MTRRAPETPRAVRLATGVAGLALSGVPVHASGIGPVETAAFRAVNSWPDACYRPLWLIMQAGNVLAAPAAATVALATGRPRLAARLVASGTVTWTAAKVVKRVYRRPRPVALVAGVRCRGPEASGLGYVSGHAGIATGIAVALLPETRGWRRTLLMLLAPSVGLGRIYVGAHLPLDVIGGAALGMAVDAVVSTLVDVGTHGLAGGDAPDAR